MSCGARHPDEASRRCLLPEGGHADHMDGAGLWPNPEVRERLDILQSNGTGRRKRKGRTLTSIAAEAAKGVAEFKKTTAGPPPDGHRDGETYDAAFDYDRLNAQAKRVYDVMSDGQWWTLAGISARTHDPEASISARIRDFRKHKFGRLDVDAEKVAGTNQFRYRLLSTSDSSI